MAVDIVGPANAPNTVTTRPADTRTSFGVVDTWFKDCTSALANDGTKVMSGWLNAIIGQLRSTIRGNGNTIAGPAIVTEDNSDGMLLAAIQHLMQRGQANFAVDGGSANALVVSTTPAPAEYKAGMRIFVKVAVSNTGATTINWNGLGLKNVVRRDGTALLDSDLAGGGVAELCFDGTNFQAVNAFGKPQQKRNLTIFVDSAIGSDANDGTADTIGHALATPQAAVNLAWSYLPSQFAITIQILAGAYGPAISPIYAGPTIIINGAAEATVLLDGGVGGPAVAVQGPNTMTVTNLRGQNSAPAGTSPIFLASAGAVMMTSNTGSNASNNAVFQAFGGTMRPGTHIFRGTSGWLFLSNVGGFLQFLQSTVFTIATTITATSSVASAIDGGVIGVPSPSAPTFVNPGNMSGSRFFVGTNGVIDTSGAGVNYFPGSIAGTNDGTGAYA